MGLIKALAGSTGGVLADQWREYFYCDSLRPEVLMTKGQKRTSRRSSNTKGEDNIISNGSIIAVADGQCMIIVEQGKIVDVSAEPGEFVYDTSTEPSVFYGGFGTGLLDSFKTLGKRFTFGGDTAKDQRVYYFNTKEIMDNKFGTPTPVPFRVVDRNIGLDIDTAVRCNGLYSYRITDPLLFYKNVAGNVGDYYERSGLDGMLKAGFLDALQPAIGRLSALELRPNQIMLHLEELRDYINEAMTEEWSALRGISIVTVSLNSVTIPDEDADLIKQAQRAGMMRDPTMAAANLVGGQIDAMKMAAQNDKGAMQGFMGMGFAQQAGGMNASNLFAQGQQQQQARQAQQAQQQPQQPPKGSWTCKCGQVNTGKFCSSCGEKKPADGWTCKCGAVNKGRFCSECGAKKPDDAPLYKCDKCGWEPEDPYNPPKFCPECGDIFDDRDKK